MQKQFTRQELYELVWSKPRTKLAKTLGISDVALSKRCKKANIPLPDQRHWAKKRSGKLSIRPALPPRFPGASDIVEFGRPQWDPNWQIKLLHDPLPSPPQFLESMVSVRERVIKLIGKVSCPSLEVRTHTLIDKRLVIEAEREKEDRRLSRYEWHTPRYNRSMQRRRLQILNAIFLHSQSLGCKPHISTSRYDENCHEASVQIGDQHVRFEVVETKHKNTANNTPKKCQPHFRLCILSAPKDYEGMMSWEDTGNNSIESFLTEIMIELLMVAEASYRHRAIWHHNHLIECKAELEEQERQRKLELIRQAAEERKRLEQARVDRLMQLAISLQQADTIRTFVAKIRGRAECIDASAEAIERWANWALTQADRIDPIKDPSFLEHEDQGS